MSSGTSVPRLPIRTDGAGHAVVHCPRHNADVDVSSCQECGHCVGLSARDSYLVCGWHERDTEATKGPGHMTKRSDETPTAQGLHVHESPAKASRNVSMTPPLGRFEKPVVTAKLDDTAFDVAQSMRDSRVGCVVVVRQDHPVGILTDRDLVLRVIAEGLDARTLLVSTIVTYDATTVRRTDGFETAVRMMREHGVRRLPIVDEDGHLTGIVTADDLVALLGRELSSLGEAIAGNVDGSESR